jgi:predicted nucleic acid-binding Zn ribbon protein
VREWAPATPLAAVQRAWPEAVGPLVAAEAQPVAERSGVVTVACRSAVWASELDLMAPDLIERLNAALEGTAVQRLRCQTRGALQ